MTHIRYNMHAMQRIFVQIAGGARCAVVWFKAFRANVWWVSNVRWGRFESSYSLSG